MSILTVPVGIVTGAICALFGRVLLSITAFRGLHPFQLIPFLFIGGAFVVFYYTKFGKGSEKGMGLVFDVGHGNADDIPLRLVPFIMVGTWITHIFGGSAGREGVAVQIGATLSTWLGKLLNLEKRFGISRTLSQHIFLVAGMAAGFAGLFRTPLAAVFFACEVLVAGRFDFKALLPSLTAAFTASTVSGMCGLEKFTAILSADGAAGSICVGAPEYSMSVLVKLAFLGVIYGLIGCLFAVSLAKLKKVFAWLIKNPVMRIAVLSVPISIVLLMLHQGRYAGLGTNLISASFTGGDIYVYDFILKLILTVVTLAAGFQGGEVTPLFSIGASLGIALAGPLGMTPEVVAALGYAAVFGSAANTYFAPIFIGLEVFGPAYLPYFVVVCTFMKFVNLNKSIYGKQKVEHILLKDR